MNGIKSSLCACLWGQERRGEKRKKVENGNVNGVNEEVWWNGVCECLYVWEQRRRKGKKQGTQKKREKREKNRVNRGYYFHSTSH